MINPKTHSDTEKLVLIAQKGFDSLYEEVANESEEDLEREDPYEDFFLIAITWSTADELWVVSFHNTCFDYIHVFIQEDKNKPNSYLYDHYCFEFEPDYN